MKKMIKKIYTLLFLLTAFTVFGQQKPVQASIDSTKIKIGAQAKLTLKVVADTATRVNFPEGKNFGQLEVLQSYPVDTVRKGKLYELVKKYGLTQFDSGRYVIPRLPVVIGKKTFQSDSLLLEVNPIRVDTLQQKMYDIKDISKASGGMPWWVKLLISLAFIAAVVGGIWWYRTRKKQPVKKEKEVLVTPIEKATAQLQNLEAKELLQRGEVKEYYSEMADIARTYIEEAIHIPAMESTTGELIEAMRRAVQRRNMGLKPETFEQLERVLRNADMVKFAKSRPLDFEIAEDRNRIEKTIVVIDRSIPEEKDEDEEHSRLWLEAQRKKKAKRRQNIIILSSVAAVVLLLGIGGFIFVKDTLFGVPTKELLEGQWVKSEYGNPGISIETPRVLTRVDAATFVPKDAMALIKEMQMFAYGTLFDDMYVVVSTISFKQQTDPDLAKASENVVKIWESQGAQNILLKTEEFKTPSGIDGIRTYGTMDLPHPITKKVMHSAYELYFFKQQQGLQEIILLHKQGDEYAPQIVERIKNSIELRNQNQ